MLYVFLITAKSVGQVVLIPEATKAQRRYLGGELSFALHSLCSLCFANSKPVLGRSLPCEKGNAFLRWWSPLPWSSPPLQGLLPDETTVLQWESELLRVAK